MLVPGLFLPKPDIAKVIPVLILWLSEDGQRVRVKIMINVSAAKNHGPYDKGESLVVPAKQVFKEGTKGHNHDVEGGCRVCFKDVNQKEG